MQILAISGSLRAVSSNTILLRAASRLAPENVEITIYNGLGDLPHFNPDLDGEVVPPAVRELRRQLQAADGVLVSSPEYAHGLPGSLKNALDWLVSSTEVVGKRFALLNASPRSTYAQASLREVLKTMAIRIVDEASITLPLAGRNLDEAGIVADPEISSQLRSAIAALAHAIEDSRSNAKIN